MPEDEGVAAAIEVSGLVKRYGSVAAVDGISFRVTAGLFGFIGPNGAGKSTTVSCLSGLLEPTAGSIRLFGEELRPNSALLRKRIGVLPERLGLFDDLYADEFLTFIARMFGVDKVRSGARTNELLSALELDESKGTRIGDFSSGMRKKLAFAAALIHEPEILFLDEPFEGIDPGTVATLKGWLRAFVAGGKTVFITSHVLDTVERLCDRVAIIAAGRMAWQGDVRGLASGRPLELNGESLSSLEAVYMSVVGHHQHELSWLSPQ